MHNKNYCVHLDETTPHFHVYFVPFATEQKRGLSTRNSLSEASLERLRTHNEHLPILDCKNAKKVEHLVGEIGEKKTYLAKKHIAAESRENSLRSRVTALETQNQALIAEKGIAKVSVKTFFRCDTKFFLRL